MARFDRKEWHYETEIPNPNEKVSQDRRGDTNSSNTRGRDDR